MWWVNTRCKLSSSRFQPLTAKSIKIVKRDHIYMETTQDSQSWCYQKSFWQTTTGSSAIPTNALNWAADDDFYLIFYYKVVTAHKNTQADRHIDIWPRSFFLIFKNDCALCPMLNSTSNRTEGNALQIRQVVVATRALCWSFDFCYFLDFISIWLSFCFPSLKPNAQHFLLPRFASCGLCCLVGFSRS